MNKFFKKIRRNDTLIFIICATISLLMSFFTYSSHSLESETKLVERKLISRQKTLDKYAQKVLKTPATQWPEIDNFPDDMVIYKYCGDTLQSWINLFPISNDEVDLLPIWYRIHNLNSRNLFNTPLAYLKNGEQYVNLGSSWYVVKIYKKRDLKLISGLKIKTEYLSGNSIMKNSCNKSLGLNMNFNVLPLNQDDSHVVNSKNGTPLFSIISESFHPFHRGSLPLKWISLFFFILSVFSYHLRNKNIKSFNITFISLLITAVISQILAFQCGPNSIIFSPELYADNTFVNSLGQLLIGQVLIFLVALAFFTIRRDIYKKYILSKKAWKILLRIIFSTVSILVFIYIHISLRSLIFNSNINLELYRLQNINFYSILVYLGLALLFFTLLMSIQMTLNTIPSKKHLSIFSNKNLIIYIVVISIYTLATLGISGFSKEVNNSYIWTNKLASERDLSLEIGLRDVEKHIVTDPFIRQIITIPHSEDLISQRLSELYFHNITQNYNVNITVCRQNDKLQTRQYPYPVDCYHFFQSEIINKYGIALDAFSSFYFINNYKEHISYIGAFTFIKHHIRYNLYLEINSKLLSKEIGYPSLLVNQKNFDSKNIPTPFSYAKYYENKLSSYSGRYNYPIKLTTPHKIGYYTTLSGGYRHFINQLTPDAIIFISRPERSIWAYLISLSYTILFFAAIIISLSRISRKRTVDKTNIHSSFTKKINYLVTLSLVTALIFMGIGSVLFTINLIHENNTIRMEEKLSSVQNTISEMCKYASQYNEINTQGMFQAMDRVAKNTHVDINLFDPHGRLIRSTKPDVFNQYLASSRIKPDPYYQLIYQNKHMVIIPDQICGLNYYSLYAPIFNLNGKLITIAHIPYFYSSEFNADSSSILAAIINLYLLLIIVALISGHALSNSVTKPLVLISRRMQEMDINHQTRHIDYSGQDELGMLVRSYNNMVDDLKENTKILAERERQEAWKQMARQIAHEIKNPLTPMRLSIQHLVRMKKQGNDQWINKFEDLSKSLLEQIDILSDTASEFSSFAKFYQEDDTEIDLVKLIYDEKILFDHNEKIKFILDIPFSSAIIKGKKEQLVRTFVNLISNGIQALDEIDNPFIKISISVENRMYKVDIQDNGLGIKNENLEKLFTPNFTTKTSGTGLGLSICKNIIEQTGGEIHYKKSEFGGADFYFTLPIL
ncbi:MAG: ATP-binding protein [Bacteroidales bacterium]